MKRRTLASSLVLVLSTLGACVDDAPGELTSDEDVDGKLDGASSSPLEKAAIAYAKQFPSQYLDVSVVGASMFVQNSTNISFELIYYLNQQTPCSFIVVERRSTGTVLLQAVIGGTTIKTSTDWVCFPPDDDFGGGT